MMKIYYKIARPDGWDNYTGKTINYRENIGKRVRVPYDGTDKMLCSNTVIHASEDVLDALSYSQIPCSVYEVSGRPIIKDGHKCGFRSLKIGREIPESEFNELFCFDYGWLAHPVNPLEIDEALTERHKELLKEWASVWDSVGGSVWASVRASVRASVGGSVWASVGDSVWASVRDSYGYSVWDSVWASVRDSYVYSVWASVWDSVRDSVGVYIGYALKDSITDWEYVGNQEGEYPFMSGVELWKDGYIPLRINGIWHLWKQNGGIVYTMAEGKVE